MGRVEDHMTEKDMEIQTLRRKVKELEQIRQLDMAEIVRLRRMIDIKEDNVNEGIQSNR